MKIKVLVPNKETGLFEFTKEELEDLLDEAYQDGYADGRIVTPISYAPGVRTPKPEVALL